MQNLDTAGNEPARRAATRRRLRLHRAAIAACLGMATASIAGEMPAIGFKELRLGMSQHMVDKTRRLKCAAATTFVFRMAASA